MSGNLSSVRERRLDGIDTNLCIDEWWSIAKIVLIFFFFLHLCIITFYNVTWSYSHQEVEVFLRSRNLGLTVGFGQ